MSSLSVAQAPAHGATVVPGKRSSVRPRSTSAVIATVVRHAGANRLARHHLDPATDRNHLGAAQPDPEESDVPELHHGLRAVRHGMYLRTTTLISLVVVATNLILGAPAAYAMARYNFFGDKVFYGGIIFFRMIPPIAAIVPLFMLFEQFRPPRDLHRTHRRAHRVQAAGDDLAPAQLLPRCAEGARRLRACRRRLDTSRDVADCASPDPAGARRDGRARVPLDLERPACHAGALDAHRDRDAAAGADEIRPRVRGGLGVDDRSAA